MKTKFHERVKNRIRQEYGNDPVLCQQKLDDYEDILINEANIKKLREQSPEFKINNLEYDLKNTDWIVQKVKESDAYAQNLYAALCNVEWQRIDVIPILKDERWGCSWRYAGGIISDIRQSGDYLDWYCSGIRDVDYDERKNSAWDNRGYVHESHVTDEIKNDLHKIFWQPFEIITTAI